MGGKDSYGPYNSTQGGIAGVVADPPAYTGSGTSGATEPTWPTTEFDTVVDGGVTWTAIFARTVTGVVGTVLNPATFQHNLIAYPSKYFQYGTITFVTGDNAGYSGSVRDSKGVIDGSIPYIFMLEAMANPIQPGDEFTATVGCAKIRLSCQQFNNLDNHRAFPDMPTEERALATPNISSQGYAPKSTK
jgi:hypothetical protein